MITKTSFCSNLLLTYLLYTILTYLTVKSVTVSTIFSRSPNIPNKHQTPHFQGNVYVYLGKSHVQRVNQKERIWKRNSW